MLQGKFYHNAFLVSRTNERCGRVFSQFLKILVLGIQGKLTCMFKTLAHLFVLLLIVFKKVKGLKFIVLYKYGNASTSQRTSHSTFLGRPVLACAFLRPLGAIHQFAAF